MIPQIINSGVKPNATNVRSNVSTKEEIMNALLVYIFKTRLHASHNILSRMYLAAPHNMLLFFCALAAQMPYEYGFIKLISVFFSLDTTSISMVQATG